MSPRLRSRRSGIGHRIGLRIRRFVYRRLIHRLGRRAIRRVMERTVRRIRHRIHRRMAGLASSLRKRLGWRSAGTRSAKSLRRAGSKALVSRLGPAYAPSVRIAVAGMAIAGLLVAVLGVVHVARRQQVIRMGYELTRATEELSQMQEENRRLRLEKATLTNPERIRWLAESLGMTQPGPDQIRVLSGSQAGQPAGRESRGVEEPHVQ